MRLKATLNVEAGVRRWSQCPSCFATLPLGASAISVHTGAAPATDAQHAPKSTSTLATDRDITQAPEAEATNPHARLIIEHQPLRCRGPPRASGGAASASPRPRR